MLDDQRFDALTMLQILGVEALAPALESAGDGRAALLPRTFKHP
jgi:hypothetical protein